MRRIAFIHFPYFYASIACSSRPQLIQSQLMVHREGRVVGVSPELAAYALTGQKLSVARGRCPDASCISYQPDLFASAQRRYLQVLAEVFPLIEPVSEAQCYFDLSGTRVSEMLKLLKSRIPHQETGPALVGVGGSKLVAGLAARSLLEKNGHAVQGVQTLEIPAGQEEAFLDGISLTGDDFLPSPVRQKLQSLGFATLGQVRELALAELNRLVGDYAYLVYLHSRGRDNLPVLGLYPPDRMSCAFSLEEGEPDYTIMKRWIEEGARLLGARLAETRQGCRELSLRLQTETEDLEANRILPTGAQESIALRHIFSILLDSLNIQKPVGQMVMTVSSLYSLRYQEQDLFDLARKPESDVKQIANALREKYPGAILTAMTCDRRETVLTNWDPWRANEEAFIRGDAGVRASAHS